MATAGVASAGISTTTVYLLGRPRIERHGLPATSPRGHKSWAVLAYLALAESGVSRRRLAEVLYAEADDPLGALRWTLATVRQAIGIPGALRGDPLELPAGLLVDVSEITDESADLSTTCRAEAELLEGMAFPSAPEFELWLAAERRHLAGIAQAALRAAALASRAAGTLADAVALARRAVAIDPLDQACQAVLLRSLAEHEGVPAAEAHLATCAALLRRELGIEPGQELTAAVHGEAAGRRTAVGDAVMARGQLDAGRAAVDAGAVEPGIECLRSACAEARACGDGSLLAASLAELGTALVHAVRGRDEEGAAVLHEALVAAEQAGDRATAVTSMRELGYVDVQAGRNAQAGRWLARALRSARGRC